MENKFEFIGKLKSEKYVLDHIITCKNSFYVTLLKIVPN